MRINNILLAGVYFSSTTSLDLRLPKFLIDYNDTNYKSSRNCSDIEVENVIPYLNSTGGCFSNITGIPDF